MKISQPIFIWKTRNQDYVITGNLEGYGVLKIRGRSEEEVKERFFDACNKIGEAGSACTCGGIRTAA